MTKQLLVIFILKFFSPVQGQDLIGQFEYMSLKNIKRKWGNEAFKAKAFKNFDSKGRAKLAYSLIQQKKYIGKTPKEIFSELGSSSGYFFSESVPAYVIGDINEKPDELWQVVFFLSKNGKKISSIRVQKKCCYKQ